MPLQPDACKRGRVESIHKPCLERCAHGFETQGDRIEAEKLECCLRNGVTLPRPHLDGLQVVWFVDGRFRENVHKPDFRHSEQNIAA